VDPQTGPERHRPRAVVRALAVTALLTTTAYLGWRISSTLSGATLWLSVWLLALEIHALLSLALHTFDLWDLDAVPDPRRLRPARLRIAVLIPTYNEPREVLLPTLAAAVALEPAHETWILDDGARPWVAELARGLGANYRARIDHDDAKAGNINAVLPELDVDLIAVLDADHVAFAGFLTRTSPYFADPKVALVQTPQDFYNDEHSFEHVEYGFGRRFAEQNLFYRAVAAGRNRWNAAFWCGTNAVIRLAALRQVGGVSTESVTEDIHTTIRMHRRGWRTVYHNEVLARGLAAGNATQYLSQRLRWGTGAMQVLRIENPAVVSGLTLGQRISFMSTLLGWFESWRTLGYLLLPVLTVLSGAIPLAAPLRIFLPVFLVVFVVQRLALRMLARGYATLWHATLFEFIRMPANLRATLALFSRRRHPFVVTAKGRGDGSRTRVRSPRLLTAVLIAQFVALAWYAGTLLGYTSLHYQVPWIAHGAVLWILANTTILAFAIDRIRSPRFAAERRASVRFRVDRQAFLDGHPVRLEDVSLTGASLLARSPLAVPGQRIGLGFATTTSLLNLAAIVRSAAPDPGSSLPAGESEGEDDSGWVRLGIEFDNLSDSTTAELALALFRTGLTPQVVYPELQALAG
jgi:cellulose synthase (UDP-forming)